MISNEKNALNFYDLVVEVLDEKRVTIKDLENSNVIAKNAIYDFSTYTPALKTIIKIANFLNVSMDYLIGKTNENKFKPYKLNQSNFFLNLTNILKSMNIDHKILCQDLNIPRMSFYRWKHGIVPRFSTIIDISNYLGCMIDDLLEHENI